METILSMSRSWDATNQTVVEEIQKTRRGWIGLQITQPQEQKSIVGEREEASFEFAENKIPRL